MRLAIADPPYPGHAHLYKGHPDYAGEVDHLDLISTLRANYDGWALCTSAAALRDLLDICPPEARVLAWVKHTVTVSWEPVIVDDLFPGSGNVGRAWDRWHNQPALPIARSAAAEGRAGRRAMERALAAHPTLGDAA